MDKEQVLLTIEEVAFRLGVRPLQVRRWVRNRRLGSVKLVGVIRIPVSEVTRMIDEGRVPARQIPQKQDLAASPARCPQSECQ